MCDGFFSRIIYYLNFLHQQFSKVTYNNDMVKHIFLNLEEKKSTCMYTKVFGMNIFKVKNNTMQSTVSMHIDKCHPVFLVS